MSRRSRERVRRMREARQKDGDSAGPIAAIKIAGFGAALIVFAAVAVGFRGEETESLLTGRLSQIAGLTRPGFLGLSAFDWITLALVAGVCGLLALRLIRRR